MAVRSHYDNLKVSRDAPPEVIKAAYRALSQKHHPDKGSTGAIMKIINAAYEVLSDPEKRANYDEWLDRAENQSIAPQDHQSQAEYAATAISSPFIDTTIPLKWRVILFAFAAVEVVFVYGYLIAWKSSSF